MRNKILYILFFAFWAFVLIYLLSKDKSKKENYKKSENIVIDELSSKLYRTDKGNSTEYFKIKNQ